MIGHRLNDTLTVWRAVYVPDGAGGRTSTPGVVGTIRAQVSQPSAAERAVAAQAGANLTHVVHATYGVDVERGDELEHADHSRRLRVLAVIHNSRRTYAHMDCEVTQGG